jgi:hypothetical protein
MHALGRLLLAWIARSFGNDQNRDAAGSYYFNVTVLLAEPPGLLRIDIFCGFWWTLLERLSYMWLCRQVGKRPSRSRLMQAVSGWQRTTTQAGARNSIDRYTLIEASSDQMGSRRMPTAQPHISGC